MKRFIIVLILSLLCYSIFCDDLSINLESTKKFSSDFFNATSAKRNQLIADLNGKHYTIAGCIEEIFWNETKYELILFPINYQRFLKFPYSGADSQFFLDSSLAPVKFRITVSKDFAVKQDRASLVQLTCILTRYESTTKGFNIFGTMK